MLQTGQDKGQIAHSNVPSTDFTDDVWILQLLDEKCKFR